MHFARVIENYRNPMGVLFQCEQFFGAYQTLTTMKWRSNLHTLELGFFFVITQCVQVKL